MANPELWEIEVDFKTDKWEAAKKKYDESLNGIKEKEKRLTEAMKNEGKVQTANALTDIKERSKIRMAAIDAELKAERDAAQKLRKQREADAKLIGQTSQIKNYGVTNLKGDVGSQAYIQQLRSQLRTIAPGTENYDKINASLKNLIANYNAATGKNKFFSHSLLETGENLAVVAFAAYMAAQKFLQFGESTVKAAGEQEAALLQLKGATMGNMDQFERLSGFATEMQNKWGIPDEVTESLIAYGLAQGRTEQQIQKNIEAARILAIVNKTDVDSAYRQIDATFEGNVRSLGRQEKDFKSLTEEQLQNGAAVDLIISKWGQLGNNQDSITVKTNKLTAAWSETKETIGAVIVDALSPLGDSLANIGLKGQDVVKWIVTAVTGIGTLSAAFKVTDQVSKDLIMTFHNLTSQIPVVGGFYGSISDYAMQYRDLLYDIIGVQNNISMGATYDNAHSGTRNGGKTKTNDAFAPTKSTNKSGNGSKTSKQEKEEELNLIKLQEQEYAKLQKQYDKNLGDLGAQNDLRLKMLDIEREIFRLRYGADITMKNLPDAKGINTDNLPGINMRRGFKLKSANANDGRGDMTSEEIEKLLAKTELSFDDIKNTADNIVTPFQNILEFAGLTETSFGQILSMVQTVLNTGSGIFGAISSLLSFIPGGSVIGGAINTIGGLSGGGGIGSTTGGGLQYGGGGLPNYTMPNRSAGGFNGTVIVNSEVEKTKSVKFYQNTFQDYSRRQAVKTL